MEARLKEKEAGAAQAGASILSSTPPALAHEINQPMTAACALARSVQHILRMSGGDLTRADNNLTAMTQMIMPAAWCTACAIFYVAAARM